MPSPPPVPVTLASLTTPSTPTEVLTLSLELCQQFGLPTTAWQSVQMVPALLNVNAVIAADSSSFVALFAQGGYASLAATMVDNFGNPITSWMQLRATDQYGIIPFPASAASGPVPYTNSTGTAYPYSPNNPLRFQNPFTLATYATTGTGALVTNGASGVVNVVADVAGAASTTAISVTLTLLTPLVGVTILPQGTTAGGTPTASLVGSNAETNQALLLRGQNKLAVLAPIQSTDQPGPVVGGARGVYDYVAKAIPQGPTSNAAPPFTVTSPITRTTRSPTYGNGTVVVYIANDEGPPNAADIAVVQAAVNAYVIPGGFQVTIAGALQVSINVAGTAYIKSTAGVTSAQAIAAISNALANYLDSVPIGGYTTTSNNILPFAEIEDQVFDANGPDNTVDLTLTSPSGNTAIGPNGVPVLGTVIFNVVFV